MYEQKEILTKWLRTLFYVQIVSMVITAINAVSYLDNITGWLSKGCAVVAIWSFLQLKDVHPRYQTTAMAKAAVLICGLLTTSVNTFVPTFAGILMLAGSLASLAASYQEYHAHGELVEEAVPKLGKQWKDLFVWEIVVGLGISAISVVGTIVMVSADMLSGTITTVIMVLTTLCNLAFQGLYLWYMKRTLNLLEN